jgi:hypothetical protein
MNGLLGILYNKSAPLACGWSLFICNSIELKGATAELADASETKS